MRVNLILIMLSFLSFSTSAEKLLPFTSNLPRISNDFRPILKDTWEGIKERNIDKYNIKAIHRPKSEIPGDFVSEGIGYGMILALYANDQEYFNKIWDAGEKYMLSSSGNYYDWRCDINGNMIGYGAATDAEEDIACMLIFADKLVEAGIWKNYTNSKGVSYKQRAKSLVKYFPNYVGDSKNILPWIYAGTITNIGYFAPAFYKVFDKFEGSVNSTFWAEVIDKNYSILEQNPGYSKGLIADWVDDNGNLLPSGPGYNTFDGGKSMYKDAIRIYWRIATDYLWFKDIRAKKFLDNAMNFLRSKGGIDGANFYQMNGDLVSIDSVWIHMNDGKTYRARQEHSALTVGMWAPVVLVSGNDDEQKEMVEKFLSFYEGDKYWGHAKSNVDYGTNIISPNGVKFYEDTLHNEMYFDQFLAWFGASTISGNFVNVLDELSNENWKTVAKFDGDFSVTKEIIDNNIKIKVSTKITKNSYYTVTLFNKIDNKKITYSCYTQNGKIDTTITTKIDDLFETKSDKSELEVIVEIEDSQNKTESFIFSKTNELFFNKYTMHIGPNPMNDILNINFNIIDNKKLSFKMYSENGSIIKNFSYNAKKGKNKISCDVSNFKKGIYKLLIDIDSQESEIISLYKI